MGKKFRKENKNEPTCVLLDEENCSVKRLWSVPHSTRIHTHTHKVQSANYKSDGICKHLLNLSILMLFRKLKIEM